MVSAKEVFLAHANNPGFDPTVAELRRSSATVGSNPGLFACARNTSFAETMAATH